MSKIPTHNENGSLTDYGKSIGLQAVQIVKVPELEVLVDISESLKKLAEQKDEPIELSVELEITNEKD